MMNENDQILRNKLLQFKQKYYKNELLKGLILLVGTSLLVYLLIITAEYFGRFNTVVRTILFYSYWLIIGGVGIQFILIPLIYLLYKGKKLSDIEAEKIIRQHFPDVKDRLLNVLQLQALTPELRTDLVKAGIDQKIAALRPIPFVNAISIKKSLRYLRYALPLVVIVGGMAVVYPAYLTGPGERIVQHQKEFKVPPPFVIHLLNEDLRAIKGEDFLLEVEVRGAVLPNQMTFKRGNYSFNMQKQSNNRFSYLLKGVHKNLVFRLIAGKEVAGPFTLQVLPNPHIYRFSALFQYPSYTGLVNEEVNTITEFIVPEGTDVLWRFYTHDTDRINVLDDQSCEDVTRINANTFHFQCNNLGSNQTWFVHPANKTTLGKDTLQLQLTVVPDQFPAIQVEEMQDSTRSDIIYFQGNIRDDYGFKKLVFNTITNNQQTVSEVLPIPEGRSQFAFYHALDLLELNLQPEDEIRYYFTVWDNDGVNGSKKTSSQKMVYRMPGREEMSHQLDVDKDEFEESLTDVVKEAKALDRALNELERKLVDMEQPGWEEKQRLQDIIARREGLEQKLESLKNQLEKNNSLDQELNPYSEQLMEKQRMLEALFDQLMNDEMKALYEELQTLMDELNKDKMQDMMEKLQMSNEELETELDRSLELFKQMEFEKKLEETIDRLQAIEVAQKEIEGDLKTKDQSELSERQKEQNSAFEQAREKIDDLEKKNDALNESHRFPETETLEEQIQDAMEESLEQIQQGKERKASQSQKTAQQKNQQLQQQLNSLMEEMTAEQAGEDMENLRQILDNLVQVSFSQEDLLQAFRTTAPGDPRFFEYVRSQHQLRSSISMVKDSLLALSKRQVSIEPFVNKEIREVDRNMGLLLDYLEKRSVSQALSKQQYVMTSVNNLALMLSEALEQMQAMMNMPGSGKGKGSCKKPGQGGPSPQSMKQLQEQMSEQLKQMKNSMKGKKPGQQGEQGPGGMSEQLARMAAQQRAIRKQMQQYMDQIKAEGGLPGADLKRAMQQMEQTEADIVNKMISDQTLLRQQEIMTRLLRSDQAQREREKDEKRRAETAREFLRNNPPAMEEFLRKQKQGLEMLETLPVGLRPYYKKKVENYFENIEE